MPAHLLLLGVAASVLGGGMMLGSSYINSKSQEKQMAMMIASQREQSQQFNQIWGAQLQQGGQNMNYWKNVSGAGQFGQAPGGYYPQQFGGGGGGPQFV